MSEFYAYFHTTAEVDKAERDLLPLGFAVSAPEHVDRPYRGRSFMVEVKPGPSVTRPTRLRAIGVIESDGGVAVGADSPDRRPGFTSRPGGAPFMDSLPQSVIDRYYEEHPEERPTR